MKREVWKFMQKVHRQQGNEIRHRFMLEYRNAAPLFMY